MFRRSHPAAPRRTVTRLLAASALAALATSTAVVSATAEEPVDDPVSVRTVTVRPSDRIEPLITSDDDQLIAVLAAAVDARRDLEAVAPPPPPPPPAPKPVASSGAEVWDRLARCESGGNWSINTGNGYYGGLQFSLSSWRAVGGSGYPHEASKAEQINRAEKLKARQGWGAWPACSRKLGLR